MPSASPSSPAASAPTQLSSPRLTVLRRSALADHLSVCPLRPIQCDLCFAPVLRCQLSQHYADNVASHLLALHATVRSDRACSNVLSGGLMKARKEVALLRRSMADLSRHVHSGPLFAYFFDIAHFSLLCSHYFSNDFVCGDHVFYFVLHRQQQLFSAYLCLKRGTTSVALSFVLMVKQRKAAAQLSPASETSRIEGAIATAEGKGVLNWFTLADLQARGDNGAEKDALTIGVLIKDHSSSWVYSAADALNPSYRAEHTDEATPVHAANLLGGEVARR